MRPLQLRLGGFTCFREPTEVSFEDLGLFGISGATGAGKSTLLDAVTYALYGETARLGSRVGASLISPGLEQMFVRFEFRTDGNAVYRVTRLAERKGNGSPKNETRIERLDGDASWRQLPESEKLKEADKKLAEIIGLDYQGFTRAVLLPQGAFDEFLRGSASQRRDLLVKLLGLERIKAMQQEAGERSKDAKMRADHNRDILEQEYGDARRERKRELEDELASLQAQGDAFRAAQDAVGRELAGLDEVKALLDEQTEVQKRLMTLQAGEAEIVQARKTVSRARDAMLIVPQLEVLEERQVKLLNVKRRHSAKAKDLSEASEVSRADKASLAQAEQGAKRLPELSAGLEALAGVRPLLAQLKAKGGSLAMAEQAEAAGEYSDAAWDALQRRKGRLGDFKQARGDVEKAEKALASAEAAALEAKRAVAGLEAKLKTLLERGKAAKAHAEQAKTAYELAVVADQAAALRPHLHLGEPCPVCEQVVKTLPPPTESRLDEPRKTRDEAERQHSELQESYREERGNLQAALERLAHRERDVKRVAAEVESQRARLRQEAQPFADFGDISPDEIEAVLKAQRSGLLAGLAKSILQKSQGLDPDETHARLSRERKQLEQALKAAQARYRQSERRQVQLQSEHQGLSEQLDELTGEVAKARQVLEEALARADFADASTLRGAALAVAKVQVLEARIKNHESQRELAERRDVEFSVKLAGRTLDEEAYQTLKAQKAEAQEGLERVQQRVGAAKRELERLETRLEKAKNLREEATRLDKVYTTYRTLHQDLSSNRFPDFMMARVQRELAQRASHIIREVTDGRYDLHFEEGEYSVLDAWGTGVLRSARTLSGGESFITSLALALALSDTLAGNRSLGALFLDEGFGTLDAETLDAIAAVLESLTESGRMVGVITHVSALTERFPARLLVSKGPEGSRLAWDG